MGGSSREQAGSKDTARARSGTPERLLVPQVDPCFPGAGEGLVLEQQREQAKRRLMRGGSCKHGEVWPLMPFL